MQIPEVQYKHQIKAGLTVMYGDVCYRIQDDGKGWLHIVVQQQGKRFKVGVNKLHFFEPGTDGDWIFNNWFTIYPDYYEYKSFAEHELGCLGLIL